METREALTDKNGETLRRGRSKTRQTNKMEEEIEEPTIQSIEASEDEEVENQENEGRRRSQRNAANKQSNPKGERKQSNAKGARKASRPKGERVEEVVAVEQKKQNPRGKKGKKNEDKENEDVIEEEEEVKKEEQEDVKPLLITEENLTASAIKRNRASVASKSEKGTVTKFFGDEEGGLNLKELIGKLSMGRLLLQSQTETQVESKGKGRIKRLETLKKEVEKQYKQEFKQVTERESLEEAEKRLAKMKKGGSSQNEKKEIGRLEEMIKRVSKWRDEFVEAETKKADLAGILEEMMGLDFRVNEMLRGVEKLRQWRLWRNAAVELERRLSKNTETPVSMEELEALVQEGTEVETVGKDFGLLKGLKEKLDLVNKIKETLAKDDCKREDLEMISEVFESLNMKIPETELVKNKLAMNDEIKRLLEAEISLEELEKRYEELSNNAELSVDHGMLMLIPNRISLGKDKKSLAERFLPLEENFQLGEMTEMAQLVQEVRLANLQIQEIAEVEAMAEGLFALWQVHVCLFGGELPSKESVEARLYGEMEDKGYQEIARNCEQLIAQGNLHIEDRRIGLMKDLCGQVLLAEEKILQRNGEFWKRVKGLFEMLKNAISGESIQRLAEGTRMEIETSQDDNKYTILLHAISDDLDSMIIETPEETLTSEERVERVRKGVSEARRIFPEATMYNLLEQLGNSGTNMQKILTKAIELTEKMGLINRRIEELSQNIELPEDLKTANVDVKRLLGCAEMIQEITRRKISVDAGNSSWKYEELVRFVDQLKELQVPEELGICKEIKTRFEKGKTMKNKYDQDYGKKRREALENSGTKIGVEEARGTLEILNGVRGTVFLEAEIGEIEQDLQEFMQLEKRLELAVETGVNRLDALRTREREAEIEHEREEIEKEVSEFKSAMAGQPLKNRKGLRLMRLLQWLLDVEEVLTDSYEEEKWVQLGEEGEDLVKNESNEKAKGLLDLVTMQIFLADQIKRYVESLKNSENEERRQIEEADFERFMASLPDCKVALKEERRYLEELAKQCGIFKERCEKIGSLDEKKMYSMEGFQKMSNELDKLPVKLQKESEMLTSAILEGEAIIEMCMTVDMKNYEEIKKIAERYKQSPVYIEEASRIRRAYDRIAGDLEELKKKEDEEKLSWSELEGLRKRAEKIEEQVNVEWLGEFKKRVFVKKCELVKENVEVSAKGLKGLLSELEGYAAQDEGLKEYQTVIEEAIKQAEEKGIPEEDEVEIQEEKEEVNSEEQPQEYVDVITEEPFAVNNEEPVALEDGQQEEQDTGKISQIKNVQLDDEISKKFQVTDLEEYMTKEKTEQDNKKITQFFEKKDGDEENATLLAIKKTLKECEDIDASDLQLENYAKSIIATFPDTLDSIRAFSKTVGKLKIIFKFPFLTKRLVRREFESGYLTRLVRKEEPELKVLEQKLREKKGILDSQEKDPNADLEREAIAPKKLKTEEAYNPFKEISERSVSSVGTPVKEDVNGETNLFATFNIEKLNRTDSVLKRNPLRKILRGEKVSAFEEDENSNTIGSYIQEEVMVGDKDERFSDNEQDLQGKVQPAPEFDKKLLSRELKPSVGKYSLAKGKPILYDPDNPSQGSGAVEEITMDKRQRSADRKTRIQEENVVEKIYGMKEIPPGTILKIFDGLLKVLEENRCPKVEFFTCSPFNIVNTIPEFVKEGHITLKMEGRLSQNKFEAYINKCLNNFAQVKEEKIIAGWVESHVEMYQKTLAELAKEFEDGKKVGVCAYNESVKVFLIHKHQMSSHWKRILGFQMKKVQKDSNPSLFWILIHKPYKLRHPTKSIAPEVITEFGNTGNFMMDLRNMQGVPVLKSKKKNFYGHEPEFDTNIYEPETGGLWSPPAQMPSPPKENKQVHHQRPNQMGNQKAKEKAYDPFNMNYKRSWEDANKKNQRESLYETREKKVKQEESMIDKYFGSKDQQVKKKPMMKKQEQIVIEDEDSLQGEPIADFDMPLSDKEKELERMVRKLSRMDRESLVETLEDLEEDEILELAKKMDQNMREKVIGILQEISEKPNKKANNKGNNQGFNLANKSYGNEGSKKRFRAPFYMQQIFNLFSPLELENAKKKIENGYVIPVRQGRMEQEEDFGAIIEDDHQIGGGFGNVFAQRTSFQSTSNNNNKTLKSSLKTSSIGFGANKQETKKPFGLFNPGQNQENNKQKTYKMSLNTNFTNNGQTTTTENKIKFEGNSISVPQKVFDLLNQIPSFALPGQQQKQQQPQQGFNRGVINKYLSNKENSNGRQGNFSSGFNRNNNNNNPVRRFNNNH